MPQTVRRLLLLAVVLSGWALAGSDRPPLAITFSQAVASPPDPRQMTEWAMADTGRAAVSDNKTASELSSLHILHRVILYVKDNYVDPKRVHPREMMLAALEYVEKTVPDVMVEGDAATGKLQLNVNGNLRDFSKDFQAVDSLWRMSLALRDVFDFIGAHMRPVEEPRDIEYAAVNGMLSTLDPHSVLLRPEMYQEMKLSTKGEFGGLGMVLQTKEGNLTIVKVLPKTPAFRGGIKKDDLILRIGEESTVNMDLSEAVSKLRGQVDSKISILVARPKCGKINEASPGSRPGLIEDCKGFDRPQGMTLTRAIISIESVQSKLLTQNIGYVRVKNFQGNTTRDLQAAINELNGQVKGGSIKGLVLDLRGNPGGLLEQAIQVSDLFLDRGTIVTTVGLSDKVREEKRAHLDDKDDAYPLVVLVNAGSASASEIVAGALKNLDRALIVGQQTFGKGSVQVLYDFQDDSALKLTIAKYLTPGDISIQEVGIIPDIALVPTRVTPDRVNVFARRKSLGEADLDQHFGNPSSQVAAKRREDVVNRTPSAEELRYLKEDKKAKDASAHAQLLEEGKTKAAAKLAPKGKHGETNDPLLDSESGDTDEELYDQLDAESQDEVKEDFEVLFARDVLTRAPYVRRGRMLETIKPFVQEKQKQETERINAAIAALGVDWSPGARPKAVQLASSLKPGPDSRVQAGSLLTLDLTVENRGTEPLHRVRATTESENGFLDRREFVFGAVGPGEKKSWKVPVKLPKDLTSRRDDVTVKFFDDQGVLPDTLVSELSFAELPRPAFAFNWQIQDTCAQCNGDGLIQRGEDVELLVDVTNKGEGKALSSFAQIKNASDQNIYIDKGRFKLGELAPGQTQTARFTLEVKKGYTPDTFALKFAVVDEPLEEYGTEKIVLKVADRPMAVSLHKSTVKLSPGSVVLSAPLADARTLFKVDKEAVFNQLASVGDFDKVELEPNRFAFVKSQDARPAKGAKITSAKELQEVPARLPPQISLTSDASQGAVVATGDRFTLNGKVSDSLGLLDMYVLVNDQKVFFKVADAHQEPTHMQFTTDFPLKEGNNYVVVVARETQDFGSKKTLVVRRRPAAVAQAMANSAHHEIKQ